MAIRGLLIDLDGTVFVGNALLPGALEALDCLSARGTPLLFATNMTRRPRRILLERLRGMGLDLPPEKVYTAPMAAAIWLRKQGHERIFSCMARATLEDLPGFEFVGPQSRESGAESVGPQSHEPRIESVGPQSHEPGAASGPETAAADTLPCPPHPVDAVLVGDLGDAWSYSLLNTPSVTSRPAPN